MNIVRIRILNLVLTFIGAVIFVSLFAYVTFAPNDFDQRTRDFAISKVTDKVDDKIRTIAQSDTADRVSDFAGRISDRLRDRVDDLLDDLDSGVDVFVADVLAAACKLDCERRAEAAKNVRTFYQSSILKHTMALERVQDLVEGKYDDVMDELRFDLRIFSGASALALIFALLLALFKGRAAAHLLPVSIALTGSTIMMAIWYLFGQDWVMTILFNDYWGWAYAVVLGALSFSMIDIAANRARITSHVLNFIGNAIGGAFNFLPC